VELPLFNVNAFFQPSATICVTEGELDALAVQQATGLPAVGYPGTSGWKQFYARCFSGYSQVLVIADGDEPGREAAKSVAKEVGRMADTVRVVRLDDGLDASSVLASHGADALKELIGV
jgi:DNA primase